MAQVIYRLSPGIAPRPMQRDATSVAGRSADAADVQRRMDAEARRTPSEDEQILSERKRRKKVAKEARERTGQNPLDLTVQDWADRSADLGDMFRLFPDDPNSFIDDYLNPAVAIGSMASGLGQYPLNVSQGNYGEAALNLAAPILAGTIERGAEIAAPIVGRYLTTQTPLANAYKKNPWAYKPKRTSLVRGIGESGLEDALQSGQIRGKDFENLFATPYLDIAEIYSKQKPGANRSYVVEIPNSGIRHGFGWRSLYGKDYNPVADEISKLNIKGLDDRSNPLRYFRRPDWSQFYEGSSIPLEKVRILEPHWLMRYKDIPQSKALRKGKK